MLYYTDLIMSHHNSTVVNLELYSQQFQPHLNQIDRIYKKVLQRLRAKMKLQFNRL